MRILEGGRQAVLIGDLLVLYLSIDIIKEGGDAQYVRVLIVNNATNRLSS